MSGKLQQGKDRVGLGNQVLGGSGVPGAPSPSRELQEKAPRQRGEQHGHKPGEHSQQAAHGRSVSSSPLEGVVWRVETGERVREERAEERWRVRERRKEGEKKGTFGD